MLDSSSCLFCLSVNTSDYMSSFRPFTLTCSPPPPSICLSIHPYGWSYFYPCLSFFSSVNHSVCLSIQSSNVYLFSLSADPCLYVSLTFVSLSVLSVCMFFIHPSNVYLFSLSALSVCLFCLSAFSVCLPCLSVCLKSNFLLVCLFISL
jgi:hypothetical protein